ncbi:dynamin family protein [Bacteroides salyersiae]|uniref:dynamin family protein n=1 Tax=Bacteroides salyersiae TaxID=291644 RepID=UPI001C386BFC|nr:dynamin family protein [Bacteroides salyersiae]MBV4203544.1 dynamin family protein [Bacteroides salyersiae]MCB6648886.1 dynamin family protein [Bacteroides salyersiae]
MDSRLGNHFSELKKMIKAALVADEKEKFLKELECLCKKGQSKNINIAVIGEFNSGKSTFINALLRERILKEAGRPTTATATYITRSKPHNFLQYIFGTKSYMTVGFDDDQSFTFNTSNYSHCSEYILQLYNIQTNSLNEIIHVVTAEQQVAKHVVKLRIELKTKELPKNIVIIDTPGFNPGEINFDNHLKITEDVVVAVADMAIILMPSTQPMSATLVDFLEINIHRYIHRCVFIITKIDLIPEYERESVYEYVKKQIRQLGVQSPRVYGISARAMLPVKNLPDSMKDIWPVYQEGFCSVEKDLWDNLGIYKEITIREHVYHLLKDLSNEIKDTIDGHTQKLQNTLQILRNNNIKRIEELTDDLYNSACSTIDHFYVNVPLSVDSYKKSAKDACRSIIRGGGKLRNYRGNEAPRINHIVTEKANQYTSSAKSKVNQSTEVITKEISRFRTAFHSHYRDMPSLEPKMDYAPSITSISSTSIDLSVSNSLNNDTFVGRWARNIGNFFRSEQIIQDEVISEVNDAIDFHFINLESSMREAIETVKKKQKKSLRDYCDKHIKQYGRQVEKLIEQQIRKKNELKNSININNNYVNQIFELQKSIQSEISLLLTK